MNNVVPAAPQGQLVQASAPTPRRGKWRISSVNRPTASPIPPRRWRSWWMRRMHRRVRPGWVSPCSMGWFASFTIFLKGRLNHGDRKSLRRIDNWDDPPSTLPKTNSLHRKIGRLPRKEVGSSSNHPFSGAFAASFGEFFHFQALGGWFFWAKCTYGNTCPLSNKKKRSGDGSRWLTWKNERNEGRRNLWS